MQGFTAGGFIYIAVAGVMPEMHSNKITVFSTAMQVLALLSGVLVALAISLSE